MGGSMESDNWEDYVTPVHPAKAESEAKLDAMAQMVQKITTEMDANFRSHARKPTVRLRRAWRALRGR